MTPVAEAKAIKAALMTVLSEEDANAVISHRKITMKKPLSVRAAQNLAKQFACCSDTTAAVDMMIDRCWQGFKVEWMANAMAPAPQATNHYRNQGKSHAGDFNDRIDAALDFRLGGGSG